VGEGYRILTACGAYCARVLETLPSCYETPRDCLDDCGIWTSTTLGAQCDCSAQVDNLFSCDEASAPETRVCGRLSQGIPPSLDCIDSFLSAFECENNVAPCIEYSIALIDDFEDGDTQSGRIGFGSWSVNKDEMSTVAPDAFTPKAHGANGSLFGAHLQGDVVSYAGLVLETESATSDLSDAVGIAFSAKGDRPIRFNVGTEDMSAVSNWDYHGMDIPLTHAWRRYTVRFDDPNFTQIGWDLEMAFDPAEVIDLSFRAIGEGPFEFYLDDIVLLVGEPEESTIK
jgi:hypothetical protein